MDDTQRPAAKSPRVLVVSGVVCLIAALFGIVAVPNWNGHRRSPRNDCINNLRQLDSALQQWALDHKKLPGDTPKWSELLGSNGLPAYLKNPIICPQGGIYNLGSVGGRPTCSIEGHDLPADQP
jgi:hypothetical protein